MNRIKTETKDQFCTSLIHSHTAAAAMKKNNIVLPWTLSW